MITDSLVSFEKYLTLHERFAKVYDFLKSNILSQMEDGRVAIDCRAVAYCRGGQ